MRIDAELYQIAAAKYGLQLKDPVFAALDKLLKEPKFELLNDILNNDYEDIDNTLNDYYTDNTTTKTLKNILTVFMSLNCRKGFYAKHVSGHGQFDKYNIAFYINMLGNELCNSSSGSDENGVHERGSGVVNGSKIRSAIYYILSILSYDRAVTNDQPVITLTAPCCVIGREIDTVEIYGTSKGFGTMMQLVEYPTLEHPGKTVTGYGFYLVMTNLLTGEVITKPIIFGDEKLYNGESKTCGYEMYTPIYVPFGLYRVTIADDENNINQVSTDVTLRYIPFKEQYTTSEDDFITEPYLQNAAKTVFYKGNSTKVIVPDSFDNASTRSIGATTFVNSDVTEVTIPEGVTTIE